MAGKSSWDQANRRQKLGLVWRIRKKISQIIKDYFYLLFFLLIILCIHYTTVHEFLLNNAGVQAQMDLRCKVLREQWYDHRVISCAQLCRNRGANIEGSNAHSSVGTELRTQRYLRIAFLPHVVDLEDQTWENRGNRVSETFVRKNKKGLITHISKR